MSRKKSAGWKLLFDGTTSDGWHGYGSKTIGTAWKTANGTLYLDANKDGTPKTGGDIVSDKEYRNFELQLDWKIDKNGNSGVIIYSNENKDKYRWMWKQDLRYRLLTTKVTPMEEYLNTRLVIYMI
ncbi:3-keto-disaccharide hydrolase [Niabella ginsengisoli]|uniref:3-keto-disaccharide hydrolase n=1 Tax=Niabella ginsengisoli TaxID=522298 RepID=UPI00374DE96F